MNFMMILDGIIFIGFLVIIQWILIYAFGMLNLNIEEHIIISRKEWYEMRGVYK